MVPVSMMAKASRTAELAALARASFTKEPKAIRGTDDLAVRFLSPGLRFLVNTEPLRRLVRGVMTKRLPGAYGYLLPRSSTFDRIISAELQSGATQLVLLGAGYDSRAYRFRPLIAECHARVFEVDAPATSIRKREKVKRLFGELPRHVAYVAVDFDRESLPEVLLAAGYDPSARTVFCWEGVTFYITARAVDDVLSVVRERAGSGSAIVFDYVHRSVVDGRSAELGAEKTLAYVRGRGEPFIFGLEPDEVGGFLEQRGLRLEEHLDAEEMEARYLGAFAKSEVFRVARFYGIVMARAAGDQANPAHVVRGADRGP
jgi:methyltransferase (TIGR00027 family)